MALYRTICLTFWTDTKIQDEFTPEDRYFYLYLFTNPHTNLAGCYEVSVRQMANETGYNRDSVERLLKRFSETHKVAYYSEDTKEVLLVNWHKYNWTSSEKFRKPLLKELTEIKQPEFKNYLMDVFNGIETNYSLYRYPIDTNCIDTSVTVTDTVNIYNTKPLDSNTVSLTVCDQKEKKSTRFVPPTIDEIKAYCKERNSRIDPEAFYSFYESKGWMIGKNKMKNWKMAIVTWEKHETGNQFTKGNVSNEESERQRQEYKDYTDKLNKLRGM